MKTTRAITSERLDDMSKKLIGLNGTVPAALASIVNEAEHLIDKVMKAFGNCEKCYGKGYGTATEYMQSFEDFGGEATFDEKMPVMRFCTCDRGQQLRKLVSAGKVAP